MKIFYVSNPPGIHLFKSKNGNTYFEHMIKQKKSRCPFIQNTPLLQGRNLCNEISGGIFNYYHKALHLGCCSSHRSASVDCERQTNLKLHTASLIPTSCISNCGKEMETGYFGSFFWYFGYIKWMDYMEEGRDLRTILEVYFFFCSIVKNKQFWLLVTKAASIKTGLFVMPSYRNDVELRDFIFFNCFY